MKNAYIFVLCPPFSGSTVLWKLLATSDAVSAFPQEGQHLPETIEMMSKRPWKPEKKMPWEKIKPIWETYWDLGKPLLLEKSPPNLIRTAEIMEHFNPVYFLIMVRDPYALAEALIRRNKRKPEKAASFAIQLLRWQAENAEKLEHAISFSYEQLAENPEQIAAKIEAFIPQIGTLDYTQKFQIHSIDGMVNREIVNLNQKKLNNLSPKQLAEIDAVFRQNLDVLEYWGYRLYQPARSHFFTFIVTHLQVLITTTWKKIGNKTREFFNAQ